ncbi:hypothetical protein TWF569_008993 [Orbilia oligospora]|nr:hypothetical protein TWF569_008993 [Orbilia oligospora]
MPCLADKLISSCLSKGKKSGPSLTILVKPKEYWGVELYRLIHTQVPRWDSNNLGYVYDISTGMDSNDLMRLGPIY